MKRLLLGLMALLTLTACDEAESEFDTTHRAAFLYRSVATQSALRSALNDYGVYCRVWVSGGHYLFENNNGVTGQDNILAVAGGRPYNALCGFIVGRRSSIDMKGRQPLYAYDLACPNCDRESALSVPLYFVARGDARVTCRRCKRVYNPDEAGQLVGGEKGIHLIRYHIDYDGMNILQIYN